MPTNDRRLDATLIAPRLNEALHPIATYTLSGQVVFKFAAKGKGVQAAGEQIHAVVTDLDPSNGTSPPEVAIATCSPSAPCTSCAASDESREARDRSI